MKASGIISATVLAVALVLTAPARAQHDHDNGRHGNPQAHQDSDHGRGPEHSPTHHPDGRMAPRPPEHHEHQSQMHPPEHHAGPPPTYGHEHGMRPVHDVWQPHRAEHWRMEHHTWHERGGYHGVRIPEDHFRSHFGRGRWFRVHSVPVIVVDNRPRFQFSGYWFTLVDPWPETWAATWYRTDDVSIDYVNDGYYMYNRAHPGVAIAVSVSM